MSIASLGVTFQMFNAAFFSDPVQTRESLVRHLSIAEQHFRAQNLPWSLWVCEDWIEGRLRKSLSRLCADTGLRLASDLPGMGTTTLDPGRPAPSDFEIVEVDSPQRMSDFRLVGSTCFRVPALWFAEVFCDDVWRLRKFRSFVGYRDGEPVATSAAVVSGGVAGIYNVAVLPAHRGRRYAEAMTRYAAQAATPSAAREIILQSTAPGFRMYQRMGFRNLTRILVYIS